MRHSYHVSTPLVTLSFISFSITSKPMLVLKFNLRNVELGIPVQSIKSNYPPIINPRDVAVHRSHFLKLKLRMHCNVHIHNRMHSHTLPFVKNWEGKAETWKNVQNIRMIIHIPQLVLQFLLSRHVENGFCLKVTKPLINPKLWPFPWRPVQCLSLPPEAPRSNRQGDTAWAVLGREAFPGGQGAGALHLLLANAVGGWPCPAAMEQRTSFSEEQRWHWQGPPLFLLVLKPPGGQHPMDRGVQGEHQGKEAEGFLSGDTLLPPGEEGGQGTADGTHVETSLAEGGAQPGRKGSVFEIPSLWGITSECLRVFSLFLIFTCFIFIELIRVALVNEII